MYLILLKRDGSVKDYHTITAWEGGLTGISEIDDRVDFEAGSVEGGLSPSTLDGLDHFGRPEPIGDLNSDGVVDFAVSAPHAASGGVNRGAVFILLMNPDFTVKAQQRLSSSTQGGLRGELVDNAKFGHNVVNLGDIDGDGIVELAVGVLEDDYIGVEASQVPGAIYIVGVPPNFVAECRYDEECVPRERGDYICRCPFGSLVNEFKYGAGLFQILEENDRFGTSVSGVGDLDFDGIPDLAVSAWTPENGGRGRGFVTILLMNNNHLAKKELTIGFGKAGAEPSLADGERFGKAVAGIGDLDGDSIGEVMVASEPPPTIYVLYFSDSFTVRATTKITSFANDASDEDLGKGIAGMGDLDGDGIPDAAVGVPGADEKRGAVLLLFLNTNGSMKELRKIGYEQAALAEELEKGDNFGSDMAPMGDLDGDGVPDMVVCAERDDDGGANRGALYVLFFHGDWTVKSKQKISSIQGGLVGPLDDGDLLGRVCEAGDLNGDGLMDLVVGAPEDDDGIVQNTGALYILLMNANGTVHNERKISATEGGLAGPLDDGEKSDFFGMSLGFLGTMTDGKVGVAVGATGDDDANTNAGAVYILELHVCAEED